MDMALGNDVQGPPFMQWAKSPAAHMKMATLSGDCSVIALVGGGWNARGKRQKRRWGEKTWEPSMEGFKPKPIKAAGDAAVNGKCVESTWPEMCAAIVL